MTADQETKTDNEYLLRFKQLKTSNSKLKVIVTLQNFKIINKRSI